MLSPDHLRLVSLFLGPATLLYAHRAAPALRPELLRRVDAWIFGAEDDLRHSTRVVSTAEYAEFLKWNEEMRETIYGYRRLRTNIS